MLRVLQRGRRNASLSVGLFEINLVAPSITPALGAELFADPGVETWSSPTNLTNWTETATGTSSVNQESTIKHGGTYSARFDVDGSNSYISISQDVLTTGLWYQISAWLRSDSGTPTVVVGDGTGMMQVGHAISDTFAQYITTGWAGNAIALTKRGAAAGRSIYVDDESAKELTFSSCHTLLGSVPRNRVYTFHPTITKTGTLTGGLIEYKDDNNLVGVFINGITAYLISIIGGTLAIVKSGGITYTDEGELKVVVNGTTHQLFYRGSQVSTDGTIDNSGLGFQVHAFNTYAGNTVGKVTTFP